MLFLKLKKSTTHLFLIIELLIHLSSFYTKNNAMKFLYTLLLCLFVSQLHAQYDTIYVAILPFASNSEVTEESKTKLQNVVADEFAKDYRMVLLDRGPLN